MPLDNDIALLVRVARDCQVPCDRPIATAIFRVIAELRRLQQLPAHVADWTPDEHHPAHEPMVSEL
jgi:hypothetical protein